MAEAIDNKYVVFKLNEEFYGLPIGCVKAIEKPSKTTRIPNSSSYIKGVMNLRGDVVTVLDLRIKLGLAPKEIDSYSRTIVVMQDELVVGLVVDSSSEVISMSQDQIDQASSATTSGQVTEELITGIGKTEDKRLIIILDLSKILEN